MTARLNRIGLLAAIALISCSGFTGREVSQGAGQASESPAATAVSMNGFSGLAKAEGSAFLAVHDELVYEDGDRLTLIRMAAGAAPTFSPVRVDWPDSHERSSDLEAVCKVPSRTGQFILAEAGHWESQYGRLFHIKLDAREDRASVLGVIQLPLFADNDPEQVGDQFEGLECVDAGGESILVVLGERGGSTRYRSGRLRWGVLNLGNYSLEFTPEGERGIDVDAPGRWSDGTRNRDISALYVDPEGTLWAAAAEDPGDLGPFYSVIYEIGVLRADPRNPLRVHGTVEVWREVPGFKVEALSGPVSAVMESSLSFGTEDELYGGVFRFL